MDARSKREERCGPFLVKFRVRVLCELDVLVLVASLGKGSTMPGLTVAVV
jgi:hypothetical protein